MKLLRRNKEYIVSHTPKQAAKELKNNHLIKTAKYSESAGVLTIITKPLMPLNRDERLIVCPFGEIEYTIKIDNYESGACRKHLTWTSKYLHGQRWRHPHGGCGGGCYGNIENDIYLAQQNHDFYGMAILLLNYFQDWDDYDGDLDYDDEVAQPLIQAQTDYNAKVLKNKKYAKKLDKLASDCYGDDDGGCRW